VGFTSNEVAEQHTREIGLDNCLIDGSSLDARFLKRWVSNLDFEVGVLKPQLAKPPQVIEIVFGRAKLLQFRYQLVRGSVLSLEQFDGIGVSV